MKEALKLTLAALKQIDEAMPFPVAKLAIMEAEKALAQPETYKGISKHLSQSTDGRVCIDPVTGNFGIGSVAQPENPMDTPLPCDVKVGHVNIRKGVALRTLVARMQVLYDMAQPKEPEQERFLVATIGNWGRVEWVDGVFPSVGDKMYSAPPQRTWVGLTDEEIWDIYKQIDSMQYKEFSRAIEAKLKEKNT